MRSILKGELVFKVVIQHEYTHHRPPHPDELDHTYIEEAKREAVRLFKAAYPELDILDFHEKF